MALSFSVFNKFKAIDGVTAPIRKMTKNVGKFGKTAVKAFNRASRSASRFGKKLKSVGRSMSMRMTLPIAAFGVVALRASMNFNKAMANVASLIPKSIERVKALKKTVQEMAISTGQSTDIMAEGLYQVISAFGDTSDTTKILEINAKAAAAGLAKVGEAVALTSAVMKGYGKVNEAGAKKAADLAFQTVKLGQTTFPELAASIGRVIPLAAQLGVTEEQVFAGFATLTGVTGNAAEVSTQLAGAMRALLKPTTSMQKAFKKLGYESGKAMLAEKGLVGTFQALSDVTGGNEQAMTKMFGRMEPLVAIFSLLGKQSGDYTRKLHAMKNAAGAMNEAFKEQTEGINKTGFAWTQTTIRLSIFAQKMGDLLSPALDKVIKFLTPMLETFEKLNPNVKTAILVIAGVAAALGPVIVGVGLLTTAMGALMAVSAPVWLILGAITLALVGIGAAIYQVVKHWENLKMDFFIGIGKIGKFFSGLGGVPGAGPGWDPFQTDTPISPNAGLANTIRTETESRSRVSVDFSNLPKGTDVKQSGDFQGFNLDLGFAGAQ